MSQALEALANKAGPKSESPPQLKCNPKSLKLGPFILEQSKAEVATLQVTNDGDTGTQGFLPPGWKGVVACELRPANDLVSKRYRCEPKNGVLVDEGQSATLTLTKIAGQYPNAKDAFILVCERTTKPRPLEWDEWVSPMRHQVLIDTASDPELKKQKLAEAKKRAAAKKKAAEEKQKAEEEALRKAEAEEEALRKAEEEAQQVAEAEEARRKAEEEEAKRQAEEEVARQAAEEEARIIAREQEHLKAAQLKAEDRRKKEEEASWLNRLCKPCRSEPHAQDREDANDVILQQA